MARQEDKTLHLWINKDADCVNYSLWIKGNKPHKNINRFRTTDEWLYSHSQTFDRKIPWQITSGGILKKKSASAVLNEQRAAYSHYTAFDVFLSHGFKDKSQHGAHLSASRIFCWILATPAAILTG